MSSNSRGTLAAYSLFPNRPKSPIPNLSVCHCRKYPQFQQADIFSLQDSFRKLDVDDNGYIDEATVIKATQQSERQPYDVVRQALKEVDLDSSRRVELDDYVDVSPTRAIRSSLKNTDLWNSLPSSSPNFVHRPRGKAA